MEICKAPTLQLKALNKHTHIMYIGMENVIQKKDIDKILHITAKYAHTHTHTVQTDRSEGQCGLTEISREEKCLELAFEGRESSTSRDHALATNFHGNRACFACCVMNH